MKKIEGLNASQLEQYRKKTAGKMAKVKQDLAELLENRRINEEGKIYISGQFPEDFKQEVLLNHEITKLKKYTEAIEKRKKALQQPKRSEGATMELLRRLNRGHKKRALSRATAR